MKKTILTPIFIFFISFSLSPLVSSQDLKREDSSKENSSKENSKTLYNYEFIIKVIKNFQTMRPSELEKLYPTFQTVTQDTRLRIIKFSLKEAGHFFPVFLQIKTNKEAIKINDNQINKENSQDDAEKTDFYIALPTYFVHNALMALLSKEFGKVTREYSKETSVLSVWESELSQKFYNSDCTVSCFPTYYAEILSGKNQNQNKVKILSLFEKMAKNKL